MAPGTTAQVFSMLIDCHDLNIPSDLNWPWLYYLSSLVYLPIEWIQTVRCKSQTRGRICQDTGNGDRMINEPSQLDRRKCHARLNQHVNNIPPVAPKILRYERDKASHETWSKNCHGHCETSQSHRIISLSWKSNWGNKNWTGTC